VRLFFRLDLGALLPKMMDAAPGFAAPDRSTNRLAIVDVAKNYELPIRVRLAEEGRTEEGHHVLVINKNGLVRIGGG
jgi:hypothetical protein